MPDIGLWHRCNSHCVMCTNMDSFINSDNRHYDLASQLRKLRKFAATRSARVYARNGGETDYVLFTGGEPTLHPDFFKLMGEFRKALPAMPFCLLTNGRAFAYPEVVKKTLTLLDSPLSVAVPIHGHDARSHDAVTRAPGSFRQTLDGLRNLFLFRGPGQEIEIRVILHKRSAAGLDSLLAFLLDSFGDTSLYRLTLVHFEVEGQAEKNFKHIALSLTDCVSRIVGALDLLEEFPRVRLYHFPLCVLPEALRAHAWKTLPKNDVRYLRKCRPCILKKKCMGVQRWYPERFGEAEICPIS